MMMKLKTLTAAVAVALASTAAVAGDFVELPQNGGLVTGRNNPNTDALYLDAQSIATLAGDNRIFTSIAYNAIATAGSLPRAITGSGTLTLLDHRVTLDVVLDGQEIGHVFDFVFRDSRDNKLVFGMRTLLGVEEDHQDDAELNFLYRYGFEQSGKTFSTAAAWLFTSDSDLRMYNAGRTNSTSLTGATPFDADTIRMQSDVNLSEGNPFSGLFLIKTDAKAYKVGSMAMGLFQAGEEGQPRVGVDVPGFVPWQTGLSVDDPVMPTVSSEGQFSFSDLQSGLWYDPPMVDGFDISVSGVATFQSLTTSVGFDNLRLIVDGVVVDDDLDGGESYVFALGVQAFKIVGIDPDLDSADPGFGSAFPLLLNFNNEAGATMTWTAIEAPIPEPSTYAMLLGGLGLIGVVARRRRRA